MKTAHMCQTRRTIATLAAAGLALAACQTEHLGVPGPGVVSGLALNYAATAMPHGPRVTFVNESAMTITIRYWSGRRDTTAPRGVADLRTGDDMHLRAAPGDFFITQAGRSWWPTGMSDAVVYARIDAEMETGEQRGPIWIELEQPQPFTFVARGDSLDALEFERHGGGAITPLPRDQWIDGHNGPFPVYNEIAAH